MYHQFNTTSTAVQNATHKFFRAEPTYNSFDGLESGESGAKIIQNIRARAKKRARLAEQNAHIKRRFEPKIQEEIFACLSGSEIDKLELSHKELETFAQRLTEHPVKQKELGTAILLRYPQYWVEEWPFFPNFEGLSEEEVKDTASLALLTRGEIMEMGHISGKRGKDGTTFIVTYNKKEYAIKMFEEDFHSGIIQKEAYLQEKAAAKEITPNIFAVNTTEKYIIMGALQQTITSYKTNMESYQKRRRNSTITCYLMSDKHQQQLIDLCLKLDEVGVLHNDSNPLNIMMDKEDNLKIIDFGFSTLIDEKMIEKRGPHPNINLSLWAFEREMGKYNIRPVKLITDTVKDYLKSPESWKPSPESWTPTISHI